MFRVPSRSPAGRWGLIAALVAFAAAGACSSGKEGGPAGINAAFVGTYQLETINGIALPYVESEIDSAGTHSFSLDSSSITLRSAGTFTERVAVRFIEPTFVDPAKADFNGTYKVTGGSLMMIATQFLLDGSPVAGFGPDTVVATVSTDIIVTSVADTVNGTIFPFVSIYRKR